MKRILSLILSLVVLTSTFGVYTTAEEVDTTAEEVAEETEDATSTSSISMASGYEYEFDHTCEAMYMVNLDTGITVYTENADEELPMASLTKIMTYIVAYESIPNIEDTVITVSEEVETRLEGTGSSLAGVIVGEELTGYELLNLMMIPSGNDAALALEIYVNSLYEDSGIDNYFVYLMNEKAAELGCTSTNFANSHGLDADDHYTTAREMAVIMQYAMTLPYFTDITSSTYYTLEATNMSSSSRIVYSSNLMLSQNSDYYYKYATGGKTGTTSDAGYCISVYGVYQGYSYLVVSLGSPYYDEEGERTKYNGAMVDSANLFRWAFTKISMTTIVEMGDLLADVDVLYAWNQDVLQLVAEEHVAALIPNTVSSTSILVTVDVPDSVEAPVTQGDYIGTAYFSYAGQELATVNLVAGSTIEKSQIIKTVATTKSILTSPWLLIGVCVIIMAIAFYIILAVLANNRKKKSAKVNKYRE